MSHSFIVYKFLWVKDKKLELVNIDNGGNSWYYRNRVEYWFSIFLKMDGSEDRGYPERFHSLLKNEWMV